MQRARRPITHLMLAGLLLVLVGCTLKPDNPEPSQDGQDNATQALLADGFSLDLHQSPTAAQVGLSEGDTIKVRNLPEEQSFDATVTFASGTVLKTPANVLTARASTDGSPRGIELVRNKMTKSDVNAALDTAVSDLGLSAAHRKLMQQVIASQEASGDSNADANSRAFDANPGGPSGLWIELVTQNAGLFQMTYAITFAATN